MLHLTVTIGGSSAENFCECSTPCLLIDNHCVDHSSCNDDVENNVTDTHEGGDDIVARDDCNIDGANDNFSCITV